MNFIYRMNTQNAKKKNRKKINLWSNTLRKNGFRKKNRKKNNLCPFLPILDAAAKFLLIINSKHPTQKLGFRETLEFARYYFYFFVYFVYFVFI